MKMESKEQTRKGQTRKASQQKGAKPGHSPLSLSPSQRAEKPLSGGGSYEKQTRTRTKDTASVGRGRQEDRGCCLRRNLTCMLIK